MLKRSRAQRHERGAVFSARCCVRCLTRRDATTVRLPVEGGGGALRTPEASVVPATTGTSAKYVRVDSRFRRTKRARTAVKTGVVAPICGARSEARKVWKGTTGLGRRPNHCLQRQAARNQAGHNWYLIEQGSSPAAGCAQGHSSCSRSAVVAMRQLQHNVLLHCRVRGI